VSDQTYALSAAGAEFYESTFVPALFGEWARRLVAFADVAPGASVLDVACGTGVVARTAADRVGPGASVVGIDANEAMLAVAARLRPDVTWRLGDAGALPFEDASFDLVASQAALMFFSDRARALREMGRVAGPAGRVVVQVPGRLAHSPGYAALTTVAARHAGPDVLEVLGGYFAVGEPELLTALCGEAGLRVDRFETWIGATRLDSIDAFLDVELLPISDTVEPLIRDRIVADCRDALARFVDPVGRIAAPIEVHLIAARLS
jgi:SAM-dependent methyltransferase